MVFKSFHGFALFFFIFLFISWTLASHENQVVENYNGVAGFVMAPNSNLNCAKENSCTIGGRKMVAGEGKMKRNEKIKNEKGKTLTRNMKGFKVELDNLMVFTADYRTPRPHPPKNN